MQKAEVQEDGTEEPRSEVPASAVCAQFFKQHVDTSGPARYRSDRFVKQSCTSDPWLHPDPTRVTQVSLCSVPSGAHSAYSMIFLIVYPLSSKTGSE